MSKISIFLKHHKLRGSKSKSMQKPTEVNGALEHYITSSYAHGALATPEKPRVQFGCSCKAQRAGKSKPVKAV